ncbi:PrsW family intramembrane metalloprotease [Natrononativus amylolyticus]|uniref:PrsW family intramembrane metalloprotease n=1 Tax=Natrononativus amylolyticus TaxID=2963434 RepID=UPI0020CC8F3E|nr:PrsW family intramembrane metalloprotease [Natrononativus amylolyticus]
MSRRRDPIERSAEETDDLYDVSTWEPRSVVDRFSYGLYWGINAGLHVIVLLVALVITVYLFFSPALVVAQDPIVSAFFALSIVPALLLAGYIWYADITTNEPLGLLVATFVLAMLFATFAAVLNTIGGLAFDTATIVGAALFFYLIVGPVEETVKLLAVRVLAYRSKTFDAVIDGAVYGAVAGLGFAAIENAMYIASHVAEVDSGASLLSAATGIATVRALAGPGHVIYSAIAGYYLGLAKFNPQYAGPLIVKGLLIASVVHGTYNVTVQIVPGYLAATYPISGDVAFVGYVIAFDLAIGYYLYRKITRYRRTYRRIRADADGADHAPELTEFEPSQR